MRLTGRPPYTLSLACVLSRIQKNVDVWISCRSDIAQCELQVEAWSYVDTKDALTQALRRDAKTGRALEH